MNQTDARAQIMAVIAQIRADFTTYPLMVETDNRSVVDQASQTDPYLKVEIDFLPGGGQMDLADKPIVRQVGQLCLYAVVKEGSGSADAIALLDFVTPYFDLKHDTAVKFHAVTGVKSRTLNGLCYFPALVDFWYDR